MTRLLPGLLEIGCPAPTVSSIPGPVVKAMALVVPLMRELDQLSYQWTRPYLLDDSAAREHFGIEPTPWDEVCRRTAEV